MFILTINTNRPADWQKVIQPDSETCYWVEPDGTKHDCTAEENAAVKAELLEMRVIADQRRQRKIEEGR
jgi:hypothetical protein